MKKVAAILLIILFLFPFATADGMILVQDRDLWTLQSEQQQAAWIYFENGIENLLISINPGTDLNGTRGVWIFPVPAPPGSVAIDVVKGYPNFQGDDIDTTYTETVALSSLTMIGYATFPFSVLTGIPFAYVFGMAGGISQHSLSDSMGTGGTGVIVYQHIEKMGVTSELITATDPAAISSYISKKGVTISGPAQSSLDGYIGQDYSFVVVYISNISAYNLAKGSSGRNYGYPDQNLIGSSVRFPAGRMYYPLKPTRVYGDMQIPVLLYVVGHVSPVIYDDIRDGTTVSYYTQDLYTTGEGLDSFFNGKKSFQDFDYTKIKINTPSSDFSEDLWIDDEQPAGLVLKEVFIRFFIVFCVLFYILSSMAASLLAGMLWLRENPEPKKKLLLHGLWNCATVIGFVYGTRKAFDRNMYRNLRLFTLSFYLVFAALVSIYIILLNPAAMAEMPLAWLMAILGPIIVLFMVPVIGVPLFIILCLILWKIYRSLGPETPSGNNPGQAIQFRLSELNPYEKRWGCVIGIGVLLFIAGVLINTYLRNGIIGQLGLVVLMAGLFFYTLDIFGTGVLREKIIAAALLIVPFIIRGFITDTPGNLLVALVTCLVVFGITYAVLAVAVRVKRFILLRLSRPEPTVKAQPDLRLAVVVGLICILLLLPQATVPVGLPHPKAIIWTEKGDTLAREGMYSEALTAYSNAIEIDYNYVPAWEHQGDLYFSRGNYFPAENNYWRASELDGNNATLHYKYGKALAKQGDISQAREQYQQAILLDPGNVEIKKALQGLPG